VNSTKKTHLCLSHKSCYHHTQKREIDLLATEKIHHHIVLRLFFSTSTGLDVLTGSFLAIVVGGEGSTTYFGSVLRRGSGDFVVFAGGGVGVHIYYLRLVLSSIVVSVLIDKTQHTGKDDVNVHFELLFVCLLLLLLFFVLCL